MEWVILTLILALQIWSIVLYYKWESYNKKKGENLAMKEDSRDINYEGEKGKNLATKEDIEQITEQIEKVKNEISFESQRKHTFIEQRTNRYINILYLVERIQMYSNLLFFYLHDTHSAEKLSILIKDINSTLLELDHECRLIMATSGEDKNVLQQIIDLRKSAKLFSIFIGCTASDALTHLTTWRIFLDLAIKDKDESASKLAHEKIDAFNKVRAEYNNNMEKEEEPLKKDIIKYLSVLKTLYKQDFYLKFDFAGVNKKVQ